MPNFQNVDTTKIKTDLELQAVELENAIAAAEKILKEDKAELNKMKKKLESIQQLELTLQETIVP